MTKIEEIHELLQNIQSGVSEKLKEQEKTLKQTTPSKEIQQELEISLEHTKGQLYEVNYILENFWDIISE